MTHLKIQQKNVSEGGSVENVSGAVISALYNASKDPNLVFESSDLKGDLQVSGTYQKYANELHTQYPNLNITALSWYIYFENSYMEQYWANSSYGDGTGITTVSAQSVLAFPPKVNENLMSETSINISSSFWGGGRFAFYKDQNLTTFDELGQFSSINTIPTGMFLKSSLSSIDFSNIAYIYPRAFESTQLSGVINIPKFKEFKGRDYNLTGYNHGGANFASTNITEINLGSDIQSGLKVQTIPEGCFWSTVYLQTITGLDDILTIGKDAFRNNTAITNLSDLNNNVTEIYEGAFKSCSSLVCINITNCTTIGSGAFSGCSDLLALDTNNPSEVNNNDTYTLNWSVIGNSHNSMFYGCKLTGKTIILPNLTTIPSSCFQSTNIKKVIATNVTTVNGSAFYDSKQLQELELGSVLTIGNNAFYNCTSLTTLKFGSLQANDISQLTSIGESVFWKDRTPSLPLSSTISLPNLTSLGQNAFRGRTEITSVTNLGSIETLEANSFDDCNNLTSITFPSTLRTSNQIPTNTSIVDWILPEGVTTCGICQTKSYGSVMKYIEFPSTCTSMPKCFHRSFESQTLDVRLVIKATTPPDLTYYGSEINHTKVGLNKMAGIYVPDASLTAYQNAGGVWALTELQSILKPISQLQTDSSYCWNKYQQGLSS